MIVVESHVEWDEVENFYVACVKLTSTLDAQKMLPLTIVVGGAQCD